MGICSHKESSEIHTYSTKSILKLKSFNQMNFYFSTESLLRLDADTLVIFSDKKLNLKKNTYISRAGTVQCRKIQQFADSYLTANKTTFEKQEIIMFPITITSLRFNRVILVCLRPWNGRTSVDDSLKKIGDRLFEMIRKNSIQSILITEFNLEFGIPANTGSKIIAQKIQQCKDILKIVTILCVDDNSQNIYMDRIKNFQVKMSESIADESQSQGQSNYF